MLTRQGVYNKDKENEFGNSLVWFRCILGLWYSLHKKV